MGCRQIPKEPAGAVFTYSRDFPSGLQRMGVVELTGRSGKRSSTVPSCTLRIAAVQRRWGSRIWHMTFCPSGETYGIRPWRADTRTGTPPPKGTFQMDCTLEDQEV